MNPLVLSFSVQVIHHQLLFAANVLKKISAAAEYVPPDRVYECLILGIQLFLTSAK